MKNVFVHLSLLLALVFSLSNCKHVGLSETRAILGTKNGSIYFYKMAKDNKDAICRYTCDSLTQFDPDSIAKSCLIDPVYMTESQVMVKNYEAIKKHIESPQTVIYANEDNSLEEAFFFDAFNTIYKQSQNNPNLFSLGSPAEVCGVAATTVTQTSNSSNTNASYENSTSYSTSSKGIVVIGWPFTSNASTNIAGWTKVSDNIAKDMKTGKSWYYNRNGTGVSYFEAKYYCHDDNNGELPWESELTEAIRNGIARVFNFSTTYYFWTMAEFPSDSEEERYTKYSTEKTRTKRHNPNFDPKDAGMNDALGFGYDQSEYFYKTVETEHKEVPTSVSITVNITNSRTARKIVEIREYVNGSAKTDYYTGGPGNVVCVRP